MKIIDQNKKAYHDYFIEDTYEAGIVLTGTEIKSIRQGRINLKDSFVRIKNGEAFLWNAHIAVYDHGNIFNHEPTQTRKLLLHKHQIRKIEKETRENGMTIIPTKVYLKNGRAKIEVAVAKGKKLFDKRQTLKEKDAKREMEKSMKGRFYG